MVSRYVIEIFLPLYDNRGKPLPRAAYDRTRAELLDRFGGMTAYSRSPAAGLWKKSPTQKPVRDDLVIYEVVVGTVGTRWWTGYRRTLEARFRQEAIVIRVHAVRVV